MDLCETLADGYGWSLDYCLWRLTVPQLMAYVNARSRRIDRINRAQSAEPGLPDPNTIPDEWELKEAFGLM